LKKQKPNARLWRAERNKKKLTKKNYQTMKQLLGIGDVNDITPEVIEGMPDDVAAAVISGIDAGGQLEILGKIQKAGKTGAYNKFKRAVSSGNVQARGASGYRNSRIELLNRLSFFPPEFRKALAKGTIRMTDMYYFQTKLALQAAGLVKMFQSGDTKAVGTGNVDKQKLENDKPFLAIGIQILSGYEQTINAGAGDAAYGIAHRSILNGQVTFRHDNKEILKEFGAQAFDTTNKQDVLIGTVWLDNPVILQPNVAIELEIEQAIAYPLGANNIRPFIKAGFVGTSLNPN